VAPDLEKAPFGGYSRADGREFGIEGWRVNRDKHLHVDELGSARKNSGTTQSSEMNNGNTIMESPMKFSLQSASSFSRAAGVRKRRNRSPSAR